MAVKNIYEDGGVLPEPNGEGESVKGERQRDRASELEDAIYRAQKAKVIADVMTGGHQRPEVMPRQEEKTGVQVNLSDIFRSQTEMVRDTNSRLMEMMSATPDDSAEKPFVALMQQMVGKMLSRLDDPADPMQAIVTNMEAMSRMEDMMKKRLGLDAPVGRQGYDSSTLLQIEQMKINADKEARLHEERMQLMRNQDRREDMRFQQSFQLQLLQLRQSSDLQTRAADGFRSIIDGIESAMVRDGAADAPPQQGSAIEGNFGCELCGTKIPVPVGAKQLQCPTCEKLYDRQPASAGPVETPEQQPA